MEGKSQSRKKIRVYREFERSRLEQAMLAEAYRKILSDDRLKLVERTNSTVDRRCGAPASYEDTNSSLSYAMAIGGPS